MERIGVIEVDEHDFWIAIHTGAQPFECFADRWVRDLFLPSTLKFVGVPKCSINQSDINPKRGEPAANGGRLMEVERVVPPVVVWEKKNCPVRATNNECMHIGEFCSVRNFDGLKTHF